MATCLRVAAPGLRSQSHFGGVGSAKAGNAGGGFFQHSRMMNLFCGMFESIGKIFPQRKDNIHAIAWLIRE
jgi:hypothetical protein